MWYKECLLQTFKSKKDLNDISSSRFQVFYYYTTRILNKMPKNNKIENNKTTRKRRRAATANKVNDVQFVP